MVEGAPPALRRCCAVHPGYGFLSENADFVDSCERAGVAFLGPTGATMRMFSRKHTAREFAQGAGVPVLPGARPRQGVTLVPWIFEFCRVDSPQSSSKARTAHSCGACMHMLVPLRSGTEACSASGHQGVQGCACRGEACAGKVANDEWPQGRRGWLRVRPGWQHEQAKLCRAGPHACVHVTGVRVTKGA